MHQPACHVPTNTCLALRQNLLQPNKLSWLLLGVLSACQKSGS